MIKFNLRKFFYLNVFISSFIWLPLFPYTIWMQFKNIIFIILFGLILINRKMKIHNLSIVKILFMYSVLMTVPLINTIILNGFNLSFIVYAYAPLMLILVLARFKNYEKVYSFSLIVYVSTIIIHSMYIIYTSFFGGNIAPVALAGGWGNMPIAVMGFTNSHTAMSPLLGLAVLIVLLFREIKLKYKIILTPILFYALLLSGGEGGLLSLFATLSLGTLFYLRINKYITFFSILALLYVLIPYADQLLHLDSKILMSYEEHLASWYAGLMMFKEHYLVGVGFFNSPEHFYLYVPYLNIETTITTDSLQPHNPLILLLAEAGQIGRAHV